MTKSFTTPDYDKWQELYSPTVSRWHDLARIRNFILPIIGLLFLTIIYTTIGYVFLHIEGWSIGIASTTAFYFYIFRIFFAILLPIILATLVLRFIVKNALAIIYKLYRPSSDEKLSSLLYRKLLGIPPFPPPLSMVFKYPFIVLDKPTLSDTHWGRWFGGPAILVIHDGVAVYLERGNTFSRVVGPGEPMPLLERHEKITSIVDLRPQVRSGEVTPWTKDGIHITLELRVEVQINATLNTQKGSLLKLRYPFDPLAVKAAVELSATKTSPDGTLIEATWLESAWGSITGAVSAFVAGHSLDELFLAPQIDPPTHLNRQKNVTKENVEQILSQKISEQVMDKVQPGLQKSGIKALNIQITKVTMPEEVQSLRTKYWESIRGIISAQRNSRAEAERIRIREQAHADAQRTILMAITQKLENIDADNMTEPLILSLSGLLDHGLDDPLIRPWIANESFTVLEKMRKLLRERF